MSKFTPQEVFTMEFIVKEIEVECKRSGACWQDKLEDLKRFYAESFPDKFASDQRLFEEIERLCYNRFDKKSETHECKNILDKDDQTMKDAIAIQNKFLRKKLTTYDIN